MSAISQDDLKIAQGELHDLLAVESGLSEWEMEFIESLEEKGIFTVHDLLHCTRADLLSISNFGEKTLEEVYRALEKIGFYRSAPVQGDGSACEDRRD